MKLNLVFRDLENWVDGARDYRTLVMDELFQIMVEEAPNVENWMRTNALWKDGCMPDLEYLRALPYRDDSELTVGIVAFYDKELRDLNCPDQDVEFDMSIIHEFREYVRGGVISILNPRMSAMYGSLTVFDEPFPDVFSRVVARMGG
jgi:hypothetical protein